MKRHLRGVFVAIMLLLGAADGARAAGRDPVAATRDVAIQAGELVLSGTLYAPKNAGRSTPAVVIVHGSGPTTRAQAAFWVDVALRSGLITLVLDKRGTGRSTGVYEPWELKRTPQMLSNLAADVEHAVRWLARQPGVDAERIGLVGGSQAGWIMPIVASREPLVRFLFIGEGVPLPAGYEQAHSTYLDGVASYGETRPTLRQIGAADVFAEDYIGERGFDPTPLLASLTLPVMWTFGLYDEAIPTRASIDRIGQLQRDGKRNFNIHIFPFGDHNFLNVFTQRDYDVAQVCRDWLRSIGMAPGHVPAVTQGRSTRRVHR
jgi:dienelactone hydrolase